MSSKKAKILAELREKLKLIKIDGLPNVFRSRYLVIQLFWIVILLISTSLCIRLITQSITEYFNYEVTSEYRLINEQQSIFPTVTICNFNQFTTAYAINLTSQLGLDSILSVATTDIDRLIHKYSSVYSAIEKHTKETKGRYMTDDEKRMLSDLDEFLVDCAFGLNSCGANDFDWVFHPTYLNCYRFNGNASALKMANSAGLINNRLALNFYAGLPANSPLVTSTNSSSQLKGVYVFIHNVTQYPFNNAPSPLIVTPGIGTTISVNRIFYDQYKYKYSECTVDESGELTEPLANRYLYDQVLATGYSYSYDTCVSFCAQLGIIAKCNCTYPLIKFAPSENLTYCFDTKQAECADSFHTSSYESGNYVSETCEPMCPYECHQPILDNSLYSYRLQFTRAYAESAMKASKSLSIFDNDPVKLNNNLVQVGIYYDSLSYTIIVEEPKITFENLIGALGGDLHLFLGMSLMSFLEIIELFFECIVMIFQKV